MSAAFGALHPALRYHIVSTLGWQELHSTQADAVGPVLAGENVLLLAPTAGGKTEAATFPVLSRIAFEGWRGLSVLYICPLKALLNNLAPRLERYASFLGLRVGLWHGDIAATAKRRMLREPPEILLTTPESLEAMMISASIDHAAFLRNVRICVSDELHAFAGDDRGWHLLFLLARIERLVGQGVQRIGLTATVGNPVELLDWFCVGRGGRVIGPVGAAVQGDVVVDHVGSLQNAVTVIAQLHRGERRLVFVDSRTRVEELASGLRSAGIRTFVSHASLSVNERRHAETAFMEERDCVIVATSTLELGIDVGDLDRVIQVGAPPSVASFLQRMGRSGRRPGSIRNCLLLATNDDELLICLALTTLWHAGTIEPVNPPDRPAHIFAQQVMALALQLSGVGRNDIVHWLGATTYKIPREDREGILDHMLAIGILVEDGGILGLGPLGEREFGRRHFLDLVASFTEPLLLNVRQGSKDLGTVHPSSVEPPAKGERAVLSLAGRSWQVIDIDWRRRSVSVVPAKTGGKSRWLGTGRGLSGVVCQAAEQVVAGTAAGCRLSRRAEAALEDIRGRLHFVNGINMPVVRDAKDRLIVWTFSGTSATSAIARELKARGLTIIRSDAFSITIANASHQEIADSIALIEPETAQPGLPPDVVGALKFGLCLPEAVISSVLLCRTIDTVAVRRVTARLPRFITEQIL